MVLACECKLMPTGRRASMAQLRGISLVLTEEVKTSALCVKLQLTELTQEPGHWESATQG